MHLYAFGTIVGRSELASPNLASTETPRQPEPEHSVSPAETKTSTSKLWKDGHTRLLNSSNSYIAAYGANSSMPSTL